MKHLSRCVIDASVGVKLVVEEELSAAAGKVLSMTAVEPGSRQYVPDLFYTECANVLWKHSMRYGYAPKAASDALTQLLTLDLAVLSSIEVSPEAWGIATDFSISVYDACYVATSDLVNAPLVTADARLVRRLAGSPYHCLYLGDLA